MQIIIDKDRYIKSYAIVGGFIDGIEVQDPQDLNFFEQTFEAWYLDNNNNLVYSLEKQENITKQRQKEEIRRQRQIQCFSIMDRSKFWYESLTLEQQQELREWYNAWLEAPETGIIPEKLDWL